MGHSVITFTRRGVGRGYQYITICTLRKEGPHVSANVRLYLIERLIQTFKKKEENKNRRKLWSKVEKDQEQHKKTII